MSSRHVPDVVPLGPVEDELAAARAACRNWGRWGDADVLGTLNFLDDGLRRDAARLVRRGRSFSLSQEFNSDGPQHGFRGRVNPVHLMSESGLDAELETQGFPHGVGGADDSIFMPLQSSTQWDGLGHIFDRKMAWNGRRAAHTVTSAGDQVTGIEHMAADIVGRGVLLDIGRACGDGGQVPDGFAITPEVIAYVIEAQGATAEVRRGDIVLFRTGQLTRCRERGSWGEYAAGPAPGLSFRSLGWLHDTEIAAAATDTWGFEVRPHEFAEPSFCPVHQIAIPNMGLVIGEMFDLDELAMDCADDGTYEFLLVAGPIPVTGAVGAPVNPIALK